MQFSNVNGVEISRFALGTKRFPTQDLSKVVHMDEDIVREIVLAAHEAGVNFYDTSYSNHKGEAETFLGQIIPSLSGNNYVQTSFFELVDNRYEYVFQKQLKKLETDCIDFYQIEGTSDLTRNRDIDSGAVDFFFKQKEEGKIAQLGFSSELSAENLKKHLEAYPWDYVRLRINFFDWFNKGVREQYETAVEAGIPIIAHGALRMGPKDHLKPEAAAILKDADPVRGEVDWALRFVKSLDAVCSVSCNVYSTTQLEQNIAIMNDDITLTAEEMDLLEQAAHAQKTVLPGKRS